MHAASTQRSFIEMLLPARAGLAGAGIAVIAAIAGSVLLTVSAKIQVPFLPVPMTMQTFVVVALGLLYGPQLGLLTALVYVAQGLAGLPVFAGTPERGLGLAYLLGPTGGYILGFLIAMPAVGALARRGWDRSYVLAVAAAAFGMLLIYVPGLLWLGMHIGYGKAVAVGAVPFLFADLCKLVLAGLLVPALRRLR